MFVKMLISSLDVNIEGMRNDSEAVSEVGGVWLGVVCGILQSEVFDDRCDEDKQIVPGQLLPHTSSSAEAEGDKLWMFDQFVSL